MSNSVLEITDQSYLIKLDKQEFDISFIQSLLKRIQSEKAFFQKIWNEDEQDIITKGKLSDDRDYDSLRDK
jgi:hypothetical protein